MTILEYLLHDPSTFTICWLIDVLVGYGDYTHTCVMDKWEIGDLVFIDHYGVKEGFVHLMHKDKTIYSQ